MLNKNAVTAQAAARKTRNAMHADLLLQLKAAKALVSKIEDELVNDGFSLFGASAKSSVKDMLRVHEIADRLESAGVAYEARVASVGSAAPIINRHGQTVYVSVPTDRS